MELEVYLFIANINLMNDLIWIMIGLVLLVNLAARSRSNEFVVKEIDQIPDGIAYSTNRNIFVLTSIAKRKIISVDAHSGIQSDFMNEQYSIDSLKLFILMGLQFPKINLNCLVLPTYTASESWI